MSIPSATEAEIRDLERELEVGREVLTRSYSAAPTVGDGRTLDIRVVPYNVEAVVADPPSFVAYKEKFVRGVFERQLGAADRVRVWLNFEHQQGLAGIVGHGARLEEADDGLYGSFRVHTNSDGDKALGLVNEGLLGGVSMEFAALRSRRVDGVVQRLRAHLDKVSLCRSPAYHGAEVLAVRELDPDVVPVPAEEVVTPALIEAKLTASTVPGVEMVAGGELVASPLPDDLASRLAAHGITPLERMAITSGAWDGSPGRFSDEEYRRSALFCRGTDAPPKQDCSLPVLEPSGALNTNALGAAAAALAGGRGGLANVTTAQKSAAARKLIRYYSLAKMEPPASLVALARS